ncbi:MAG TPA: glycosyltransferase [Pirellulales bacterium]|nr:glycosyltransferase [Pirellulales bacterium]
MASLINDTRADSPATPGSQGDDAPRLRAGTATVGQVLLSLTMGGGEVLAARIARRLKSRFRFVFFCLDELGTLGEELREEGFRVRVLDRKPGVDFACIRRMARWLREEKIDVLHAHQYTPFFYAAVARWLNRRQGVIFTEHGRMFPDYPRRKRMLANRVLLGRRDRVIGVGQAVRQALIANEGLKSERVGVIYNGINLAAYNDSPAADRDRVRLEFGWADDHFVIVQVARLNALKDHLTAVRAFERIHASLPEARLLIVGEGEEREAIEAEVGKRSLAEYVRLAGLRKDVPRLVGASDLLWLTSVSEGIPLTLIEGMAAGLPVVATDVGGVSEVVEPNESGLLSPAGDDEGVAQAVLKLARDPALRQRLALAGKRRAFEQFSEDQMVAAYADLYEDLIRG